MDGGALIHGFVLALALILPIGPQNAFVLATGAASGRYRAALAVVITASMCDTALIALGVAGVSAALTAVGWLEPVLTAVGIVYLVWFGVRMWRSAAAPAAVDAPRVGTDLRSRVVYSVSVSLLNPHAVLDTVGVLGTGAAVYPTASGRLSFAVAAAAVSWLWFAALAAAGHLAGRAGGERAGAAARWISRVSAVLMWAVAVRYAVVLVHPLTGAPHAVS